MHAMRTVRAAVGCAMAAAMAAILPLNMSAHEHREVAGGQYEMTVGFLDEPAFAGEKNGLDLRVEKPLTGATPAAEGAAEGEEAFAPVEGLADTLTAEVIFGDQRMPLTLSPRFRDPGAYNSYFFPTAAGDYSFRITGTIEGVQIDETFTSSPETFSSVQPIEPLQFPKPAADAGSDVAAAGTDATTAGIGDGGFGGPAGGLLGVLLTAVGAAFWVARWAANRRRAAPVDVRS